MTRYHRLLLLSVLFACTTPGVTVHHVLTCTVQRKSIVIHIQAVFLALKRLKSQQGGTDVIVTQSVSDFFVSLYITAYDTSD